jgi:hypothetical protein
MHSVSTGVISKLSAEKKMAGQSTEPGDAKLSPTGRISAYRKMAYLNA